LPLSRRRWARAEPGTWGAGAQGPVVSMREWLEGSWSALPDFSVRRLFGGAGLYSEECATSASEQHPLNMSSELAFGV
jgi:hypothetical protein